MSNEIELLKRRIDRERSARRQAESILEQKALELYNANGELRVLNESLEFKITERTRDLQTSQTRLEALIGNLHSGILVEDVTRHVVLTNQMLCDIFNMRVPPKDLVGMDCSQSPEKKKHLFENPDEFVARIDAIIAKREPVINEKCVMADGRVYERDYLPIILDGQYSGHLWQYTDITSEHYAREDLARSEDKYRGIIENMELGLMEVDNDGYIVRPYPRFCKMLGYEADELMGKDAIEVLLPPEYLPVLEQQAVDRATGIATVYEIELIKKDGSRIWVIISGAPIFNLEGRIVGSVGIHYDITYQKKLQHELEEAKNRAEEAQEAEKQFLANMSHEIRTPLNAIIGMAHLLYDTQPTEEQKEYLLVLKNSAEILRGLISDVLDLSKIRSGNFEMQDNEFDIAGLVHSMVKTFQMRFEDKPLTIELKMDKSLEYMVMGDDLMLNQILINLIGNAEKFTASGIITISLRVKSREEGHIEIEFSISDTGIGIPKEKHDLIFQSFRQVDGDIKRKFGGTGLGLAITKQLVEMQGGEIHLESELGVGTTFTFNMFYQETNKKVLLDDKPIAESSRIDAVGKRVLVVEDNHMNRKYISTLLKKWQVDYQMAHNGLEGVEMARLERFDMILMDIQMPVMDGYEATITIRNTANQNRDTPIIALTASAMLSQKDKAFKAGMNDYVSKPFKPSQLFEKMQEHCCHKVNHTTEFTEDESVFEEPKNIDVIIEEIEEEGAFKFNKRLNADLLTDLYGDDTSYACVMFEMFLTTALPEFDMLKTAVTEKNTVEVARLAHKLKPTFGMVGLSDMEEKMQTLEHAAKKKETPSVWQPLFEDVEKNMESAVNAVKRDFDKLKKYETELHSG